MKPSNAFKTAKQFLSVNSPAKYDPVTQLVISEGGLFPFAKKLKSGDVTLPAIETQDRPMTMAEKIIARNLVGQKEGQCVKPGDPVIAQVQGGYSHEFTTAQVHNFLIDEYGEDYTLPNPSKFAVFEDHLLYAHHNPKFAPHMDKVQVLRDLQVAFQRHTGVRDYSAKDGISPGICHQVAREEFIEVGDFIQATDSHTCMGGASNALTWGVGATEYANLISSGFTFVKVPESIRFRLNRRVESRLHCKRCHFIHSSRPCKKGINLESKHGVWWTRTC